MLENDILPCSIAQRGRAFFSSFIATSIQDNSKSNISRVFEFFNNSSPCIYFIHEDNWL